MPLRVQYNGANFLKSDLEWISVFPLQTYAALICDDTVMTSNMLHIWYVSLFVTIIDE